ncbi:class I tRNA ligase family protein [Allofrancisella guangzhouensis]|uniref:Methionyl/Leucyl tRNA synthetase domain-containing protein n=1 Tax=Allofrancisella guangzhouensis TaxID=594679 RepID=A0A0A8E423_9GAMM|nr:class I tRNA ligase family protein [Allofrancisella guangzhouensis]AJC48965.1 hypothetical protein SD28_04615 [Allofrancisella guangzhouensis]MBK2027870.1 class I tRNA ligase family protein [Allofrancisella guangzhouensis]MBK2044177.1 class I tRNA ligase family protein [Allofrancisella guangzhouensis]MBK2045103.1 class I tRNA ligase family protein [Allofrancisella guangzhouensis]
MLVNNEVRIPTNANEGSILLKPNEYTRIQNHHDTEIWMIEKGKGLLYSQGQYTNVFKGKVIKFEPFEDHILINTETNDLALKSFWYVNQKDINKAIENKKGKPQKYIVGCAYPTPNGPLHLGHIFGPYIISDVINRFFKKNGVTSFFATGTYGYTNHIEKTSKLLYKETVEKFEESISSSFRKLSLSFDYFLKQFPENKTFLNSLNVFKDFILRKDLVKEKEVLNQFNEKTETFIDESFVEGLCPNCRQLTIAIECENCGMMQDAAKIINPIHSVTKEKLLKRKVKKLYLNFDADYINKIKLYLFSEKNVVFSYLIKQIDQYIENKQLEDIPISVFKTNGTTIYEGQKLSIAAERALRFFDVIKTNEDYDKYLFFCGIDNTFISAIASPYILKKMGIDYTKLPICVINSYTLLNGQKFSTSRNNAIWLEDIKDYNINLLRLYYAKTKNLGNVSFNLGLFKKFCTNTLNLWVSVFSSLKKIVDSINMDKLEAGNWDSQDINFFSYVNNLKEITDREYESFNLEKVFLYYEFFL